MMEAYNPPSLDLRQLSYFVALSDHHSISAAAAAVGLAQPTLSENITRLERQVGVQLVVRGSRGIQLTEAGFMLARHGREIVASAGRALSEIRQVGSEARGMISIALPPSLGLLLSVPLAETIQNDNPLIKLHIAEALSGHVMEMLISGAIDIGCVYEVTDNSSLSFQPLLKEELFLVAPEDNWPAVVEHDEAGEPFIRGTALSEFPIVLPALYHGTRKIVERFCRADNIRLCIPTEIDSLPHIVSMVQRASAYTVLPHAAVLQGVSDGSLSLIHIIEPVMTRTAYLVRKRDVPITKASNVIETTIKSILAEMVDRYKLRATILA